MNKNQIYTLICEDSDGRCFHLGFYKNRPNKHKIKQAVRNCCFEYQLCDIVEGVFISGNYFTNNLDEYRIETIELK